MDKKEFRIKKYENLFDGYILASDSGNVALFFGDDIFLGVLFDATNTQIRDIALFNEFNPNHPNSYLCNKYNIDPEDDIFDAVSTWEGYMDVLMDIGVINENQIVDANISLESALAELFG